MSEATASSGIGPGAGLLGMLSDDRLARRAVDGDERAFAAIFRRHHQALYRFCLAIVGNAEDAQDALQNTMVKVLRALPGEERRIELKPWLYRIAHNESIEVLRRRREGPELDSELPSPGPAMAEQVVTRERLRQLLEDLEELPERQRETLVMRELAGLPFAEIGAALGTSDAVARQAVYEARLSLRQMDEGRQMSCETVTRALSDGDGRVTRGREVRAHLRACADCRRFREEIEERRRDFAAIAPLPAVAAAGILQGLLGGGGSGGAGLATALGGGAAHTAGASAVLKGVAAVAVVATVGVTAADRGGLVEIGLRDDLSSQASPARELGAGAGEGDAPAGTSRSAAAEALSGRRSGRALGTALPASALGGGAGQAGHHAAGPGQGAGDDGGGAASGTRGSSAMHERGWGHEKSLPGASRHGRQTAPAHENVEHGASAGSGARGAQPGKPSHPAQSAGTGAKHGAPTAPPPAAGKQPPHSPAGPQSPPRGAAGDGDAGEAPEPTP